MRNALFVLVWAPVALGAAPCADFSGTWKLNCVSPSSASRVEKVVIHQTGCTQIQIDRHTYVYGKETVEKELLGESERFTRYLMKWDGDGLGWRLTYDGDERSPEKGIHFTLQGSTVARLINNTLTEDRKESSVRTEPHIPPVKTDAWAHCVSLH